jgi:hypothetical protein
MSEGGLTSGIIDMVIQGTFLGDVVAYFACADVVHMRLEGLMKNDLQCPYCGADNEVCHDDGFGYEQDTYHETECSKCEKAFIFTTAIHFSYSAHAADCLNTGNHEYEKTKTFPTEFARLRCKMCGDEKPIPKETESI